MYVAFINEHALTPMAEILPAMFAKSSLVSTTIFYMYSNKQIKKRLTTKLFTNFGKFNQETSLTMTTEIQSQTKKSIIYIIIFA